jgi:hypothetical protein
MLHFGEPLRMFVGILANTLLEVSMSSVQESIISTLKLIQSNENCKSKQHDFDVDILTDIYDKKLIQAVVHKPLATGIPEFLDMKLTLKGVEFLELSNTKNKKIIAGSASWHTNLFINAILAIAVTVVSAGIIYCLGWK